MKRIRDYGIIIGQGKTGERNKITDVPGIKVGHYTLKSQSCNTGITAILLTPDNIFTNKVMVTTHSINESGDEMRHLETPIILTDTKSVPVANALSMNPTVIACDGYVLNDREERVISKSEILNAINDAKTDFLEGDVGAGTGLVCGGIKAGIGSSSRLTFIDGKYYTLGVLVQNGISDISNLIINDDKVGEILKDKIDNIESNNGSSNIIVATDLPLSEVELKRIIKGSEVGLTRTGLYKTNTTIIGFSTASTLNSSLILDEGKLDYAFNQIADATEEAILNSLATTCQTSYKGKTYPSLTDLYLKEYMKNKNYEAFIEDFPAINQYPKYPVGCESVALYTLLKYYGVEVTIDEIITNLKKGEIPHYEDGVMYGGDPEREFIGNPTDIYSYGVFESPIMDVANMYKPGIKNISGVEFYKILTLVKEGYPIQVWTSIDAKEPSISEKSWIDRKTGQRIFWKKPEHSLIVIGYSQDKVVVSDPCKGCVRELDRDSFEESYNFFGKRALYYKEKRLCKTK